VFIFLGARNERCTETLTCSYNPILTAEFNISCRDLYTWIFMGKLYMGLLVFLGTHLKIKNKATTVFAGKATCFYPSLSVTKVPD